MVINKVWVQRRWLDERLGHSHYLMFALAIVNFILIAYRYLIEEDTLLPEFVSNLTGFTIMLLVFYIPISILIGYWHRHTQLSTENVIKRLEDPWFAHISRLVLDMNLGRASKKEIDEMQEFLSKIYSNEKN